MRRFVLVLALAACSGPAPSSADPGPAAARAPRPVRGLALDARYPVLATPVGFAHDGKRWLAAIEYQLVMFDGAKEVSRWPVAVAGADAHLAALPGGRWLAGDSILEADGKPSFSGYGWAQRYGRFGSPKAMAVSPDGRVAIVDGADSPSACLCDRERGTGGSSAGALVRLSFVEGRVDERVLAEHADRRDYRVAASPTAVAAADGTTLEIWPATGDGTPLTVELAGTSLASLTWATDRYLVATRYVDIDRTDVVVLDREAGFRARWTWPVRGRITDLAIRPGGAELAIASEYYRATTIVLADERRVEVHGLDGALHARADLEGHPMSIAWSRRGDALLVSAPGTDAASSAVLRYRTR